MSSPEGPAAVAVFSKPHPEAASVLRRVQACLARHGLRLIADENTAQALGNDDGMPREAAAQAADFVVVVGGDGTLLASARAIGKRQAPILGVNLGNLGFLTEVRCDEVDEALEAALLGRAPLENRPVLEISRNDEPVLDHHTAMNDVVISNSNLARLFELSVFVDNEWVADYRADGLILATPTGSTAYNLSAGGPVVRPGVDAMIVTPICPHSLSQRPLIVPGTSRVRIHLPESARTAQDPQVTLDGQIGFPLFPGESVTVACASHSVRLVRRPSTSFFRVLRGKLGWGHP